ncbi:enoyl-CoA hydratase-related protein [Pseudidiomarina taiwanensis]|uniref:enoyl-CoA hydratase-related protein n=1 Tax=Pseudidiomarina taiwanensis TaxID=337250 RepID=UPI001F546B33|nr:enoyl-CoA hydratase-related protein [Pseudidiomarina taiwanensis]
MQKAVQEVEHLTLSRRGTTVWLQLTRSDKKNALTAAMYRALTQALKEADADPSVTAVVLTGSGDSFTAGNDLQDFLQMDSLDENAPPFEFLLTLNELSVPLIAAVNGLAIGIGTTVLLHCDFVYASSDAKFAMPFVHLGLVPEAAASLLLPQQCGYLKAAELLLLGDSFNAEQALEMRLVNEVLAADQLQARVEQLTEQLAQRPAAAVRASKALLKAPGETTAARIRREVEVFAKALRSDTARAAIAARLQK